MHKNFPLVYSLDEAKEKRPEDKDLVSSIFLISFGAVVFLSGLLILLRVISNISFSEPLHLITSGSEEQSFLSLWKFVHDQPVYTDPRRIPFHSSYLNWLFYGFYGLVLKGTLAWTGLSDAWIPTLGRMITLAFSIAGAFLAWLTLRELVPSRDSKAFHDRKGLATQMMLGSVSFYLFFGPLPAFWPLTVRPDMPAMVFELLAFYVFIKKFQSRPRQAAFVSALLCFLAWSFKQTNIAVFSSLFFFNLVHHRRCAVLMAATMLGLCLTAFWLGGPDYRASTFFSLPVPGFSIRLGFQNFFYYLAECAFALPGYIALGAVFFSKTLRETVRENPSFQLCGITALAASLLGVLTAPKIGASENYFIPASIFITFFFFLTCHASRPSSRVAERLSEESFGREPSASWLRITQKIFNFSLAVNALLIFVILFGIQGHISKRYEHKENLELLRCTAALPRPIFSQRAYLHLPWMLGGEAYIPGYTYWAEKGREKDYERQGIEGLVREGYFGSLVLEKRRVHEIAGESGIQERLQKYAEYRSSGCPSSHGVFLKSGVT